jgi:hypothetical protein
MDEEEYELTWLDRYQRIGDHLDCEEQLIDQLTILGWSGFDEAIK